MYYIYIFLGVLFIGNNLLFFFRIADDFEDDEDDNIEIEQQEEDGENFELLPSGEASGSVQTAKRITTRYMTK